jgi:hypothetical protein
MHQHIWLVFWGGLWITFCSSWPRASSMISTSQVAVDSLYVNNIPSKGRGLLICKFYQNSHNKNSLFDMWPPSQILCY